MDDIPIGLFFAALFILFLLSAFFSGTETALMTLNRYRLRHLADSGHPGARRAMSLLNKPDRLIGVILLGNNFANILITNIATYIGYRLYEDAGVAIAIGLLTLLILIFGELAPKTLGAMHSEKVAYPAAYVYVPMLTLAFPIVWLVNLIANSLLRVLGVKADDGAMNALSREELRTVVKEAGDLIPRKHQKMLVGILDLEKVTVEDIMIPRNDVVGLDLDDEWEEIKYQLMTSAYTRLPVFQGGLDNAVGFIHIRKIMPLIMNNELTLEGLRAAIRETYFIPTGTSLNQQLLAFQHKRRRVGLVVDEYGDIQGLVTLEDLLEEIVGEFTTDPATYYRDIHPQDDGSYVVEGSTHVRDINRALHWELHDNGPRTINGLILEHLESIPETGTTVLIDGYPIEVVQTQKNAVKTARIKPRLETREPVPQDNH